MTHRLTTRHKALLTHTSNENTRYAINGVLLQDNGTAVAIDGRRLLAMNTTATAGPDAGAEPLIIDADTFKKGLNGTKNGDAKTVRRLSETRVRFETMTGGHGQELEPDDRPAQEFPGAIIEGNFPKWQQVVPTGIAHAIQVDASFLADAAKAAGNCSEHDGKPIVYIGLPATPDKPLALWSHKGGKTALAVVMPVNGFDEDDESTSLEHQAAEAIRLLITKAEKNPPAPEAMGMINDILADLEARPAHDWTPGQSYEGARELLVVGEVNLAEAEAYNEDVKRDAEKTDLKVAESD